LERSGRTRLDISFRYFPLAALQASSCMPDRSARRSNGVPVRPGRLALEVKPSELVVGEIQVHIFAQPPFGTVPQRWPTTNIPMGSSGPKVSTHGRK